MPGFTAKNYNAVAEIILAERRKLRALRDTAAAEGNDPYSYDVKLEQTNSITLAMCKMFQEDNPKFKEFTFIEACNRDLKD